MPERLSFAGTPTPLQPLDRLGRQLGFAEGALWAKRDDLTALAGGGNKARKLEFLVADALAGGADVLVTGGAAQSNHVRMTVAAARMAGLECTAVLGGPRPERPEGNVLLDVLLGLDAVWVDTYEAAHIERVMAETALRLSTEGRHPYEIPLGGASPIGTLGYVVAADEIAGSAPRGAVVYTASGSGGTQAGLVVGFGHHERVRGVDVGAVDDVGHRVCALIPGTASLAARPLPLGRLQLDDGRIGRGYGARTDEAMEAIALAARLEGMLLDPVYSAKAMAALIADRREGRLSADHPTVFLHTGGTPSLFTERHASWLAGTTPCGRGESNPHGLSPTGT